MSNAVSEQTDRRLRVLWAWKPWLPPCRHPGQKAMEHRLDLIIPLLCGHPKEWTTDNQTNLCPCMFMAAQFTTVTNAHQKMNGLARWDPSIQWNMIPIKRVWSTDRCSNVDGPQRHHTKWKKLPTLWFYFYEMVIIDNSFETACRLVGSGAERREWRETTSWAWGCPLGWWKCFGSP